MSLINANEVKQYSISNIPTKTLDELLTEAAQLIKTSSDLGHFNVGLTIPKNTPENIKEDFLQALIDNKYVIDSNGGAEGLGLNIKWSNPLP